MPLLILSVIVQVALVVHILKTGRNTTWIWVVMMLPAAGAIAYFLLEVLPELRASRAGRAAGQKVSAAINPNKAINNAVGDYATADTVANAMKLADQCLQRGLHQDASDLYSKCLKGVYADDPALLVGYAQAEFGLNHFDVAKATLDQLIEKRPEYRNQDAHLLYARCLQGLENITETMHEYETLHAYFSGPEAAYYFGQFLFELNDAARASRLLQAELDKAKRQGSSYRKLHKKTLNDIAALLRQASSQAHEV